MSLNQSPPAPGLYRVDLSASSIKVAAKHMFGLGTVKGTFGLDSGEITVADPVAQSTVRATADAGSFATGNAKRDEQVHSSKFLNASVHPKITFASAALVETNGVWALRGDLTAAGTSVPFELQIDGLDADDAGFTAKASGRVDRYAHGISKMKGMAGRYLDLEITARATRQ